MKRLLLCFTGLQLLSGIALASAAPPPAPVQTEVTRLLDFIQQSGCKFFRNGTWHDSTTARQHLSDKYDYLAQRGMIEKTEDFIEKAATQSSFSGRAYQVQCGEEKTSLSAPWLTQELQRERKVNGGN